MPARGWQCRRWPGNALIHVKRLKRGLVSCESPAPLVLSPWRRPRLAAAPGKLRTSPAVRRPMLPFAPTALALRAGSGIF